MPKPGIRKPRNSYKKIIQFMQDHRETPFTLLEVVQATKVPGNTIAIFLKEQVDAKNLTRAGVRNKIPYSYRVVNVPTTTESMSVVAEAVWNVFMTTQSPMTRWDVRVSINNQRTTKLSKNSIDSAITRFTRKGALIRDRTNKTYARNPDFAERPTSTDEK